MARKPTSETALQRFADLLDRHRRNGTRPATTAGEPWTYAGLAAEIPSGRANDFVSARSVSNWCKGTSLPDEIEPILRALFGPSDRHAEARAALRAAFQAARDEKAARILAKAKPDPAGGQWVIENDQFVLDRSTRTTDQRAAKDPLRQQLQAAILRHAADLAERGKRVGNTRTWGRLGEAAGLFHAALQGEPREVLHRLGDAYASLLELGSFLETDIRLQNDPARFDEPLDADIHGVLSNLVRTAAPWLRGFPTVAHWDDEAGKALLRADLFQPARDFIRINREQHAIPKRDADEIAALAATGETEGFQGHKAGTRAVGHATNLLLAEATAVAASRIGHQEEAARTITDRALSTLSAGRAEIEAFSAHWPPDLRLALRAILEDRQDPSAVSPTAPLPAAVPDDVEEQAAALILQGQSPPAAWRPFIRTLDFEFRNLGDVAPWQVSPASRASTSRTHRSPTSRPWQVSPASRGSTSRTHRSPTSHPCQGSPASRASTSRTPRSPTSHPCQGSPASRASTSRTPRSPTSHPWQGSPASRDSSSGTHRSPTLHPWQGSPASRDSSSGTHRSPTSHPVRAHQPPEPRPREHPGHRPRTPGRSRQPPETRPR